MERGAALQHMSLLFFMFHFWREVQESLSRSKQGAVGRSWCSTPCSALLCCWAGAASRTPALLPPLHTMPGSCFWLRWKDTGWPLVPKTFWGCGSSQCWIIRKRKEMFAINLSAHRAVSHLPHPSIQFSSWHCQAFAFLCSAAKSSFFITFPGRLFTGIHPCLPHKFTLYTKLVTQRSEVLARNNYYKEVFFFFFGLQWGYYRVRRGWNFAADKEWSFLKGRWPDWFKSCTSCRSHHGQASCQASWNLPVTRKKRKKL